MIPSLAQLKLKGEQQTNDKITLTPTDELIVSRGKPVAQEELETRFNDAEVGDKTARGASGEVRKIKGQLDGESVWLAIKKQRTDREAANEMTQHAAVYASLDRSLCAPLFTEPLKVEQADNQSPWVYSLQRWACAENTTVMMLSEEFRANKRRPPQRPNLTLIGEALKDLGRALACLHATGYVHTDSHASNVMLCLGPDRQLQGVKLIDMGRVRPKREGEGFEIEWKKMNESIVKGLTGLMKATEKFKNWENDTRAAYETRLKQLTPPDALTIGSSHDPVRNAPVPTLASRAASFGDGHGGVCCTPSVLRARGTSPAPSTR